MISLSDDESLPNLPPLRYPSRRKLPRSDTATGGPIIKLRLSAPASATSGRGGEEEDKVVEIRDREKPVYMADVGWVPELPGRHTWRRSWVVSDSAPDGTKGVSC